jgi:hypothetical protein
MGALAIPLLVAVLLTGSCAAAVPATCDDSVWNPPPELSCDEAITVARAQYATTPGITGLTVQYGGICPPGAHCQIPRGNQATVGASIAGGVQLCDGHSRGGWDRSGRRAATGADAPSVIVRIAHMFDLARLSRDR